MNYEDKNIVRTFRAALLVVAVSVFASCTLVTDAMAWGEQGHQIIASLALAKLSPSARKEVDRLLELEPGATLESISTWADKHKNPTTKRWHYVNFPRDNCSYDALRDCPDDKCVIGAIKKQTDILEHEVSDMKRLNALKNLVHFVADVHQPLHAGYMDDKGGNKYQLRIFRGGSNLHKLWDTELIRNLDVSSDELKTSLLESTIDFPNLDLSMSVAAEESCKIVRMPNFYPGRTVGRDYIEWATPIMTQRLAIAGARLAGILNLILGK